MSISQGTDVERQPRPDCQATPETNNQSLARSLTTFSASSSRAHRGPASAPPPEAGGRVRFVSLGGSSLAALGLARTRRGRRPETTRLRHQRTTPWGSRAGGPASATGGAAPHPSRRGLGLRIAPLAIMRKCGPVRPASRASRAAVERARPLTRPDPEPNGEAIGAMRRDT